MGEIMIALVSAQRMQNIIPVFQRGADFETVWLVRSTEADSPGSRFSRALQDTSNVLKGYLKNKKVHQAKNAVDAYGITETYQLVANLIKDELPGSVVVNFTGGTKCMSIGAYLAAQNTGATALYVDTANEKLVWFSQGQRHEELFDLAGRLTVPVYFQANGKQIDERRTRKHTLPQEAYEAARDLVSVWPECVSTLEQFGKAVSQGKDKVERSAVSNTTTGILANYGFVHQIGSDWEIKQQGRAFLSGKWLEALVHTLLKDSREFDDVQSNLRLQGVENEMDVLVTRNGQLAIIECKSGDLGGQTTLNKLQAIRTGFGTFARSFFVTSRKESEIDRNFRNRAIEYGVRKIITAESLLQIGKQIKFRMRGMP